MEQEVVTSNKKGTIVEIVDDLLRDLNNNYLRTTNKIIFDNNFLKNINGFEKLSAIQTLSFENNKIYDYSSLDKLSIAFLKSDHLFCISDILLSSNLFT